MRRRHFVLGCALMVLAAVACAKVDKPEDPVWGKVACAHCAMLVGDKRFAAQAAADGERKYFDDIGCMALWLEKRGGRAEKLWVREGGGAWIDAKAARYATGAKTPMDFGFEPSNEGALAWGEVVQRSLAKSRGGAP